MNGFLLMVSPNGCVCQWVHPATASDFDGWIDATDMEDEEFDALIARLQKPSIEHFEEIYKGA